MSDKMHVTGSPILQESDIKAVKEIFSQIIAFLEEIGVQLRNMKSKLDIRERILLMSVLCYRTIIEYSSLAMSQVTLDNARGNVH